MRKLFPKKNKSKGNSQLTSQAKLKALTHKLNYQIKDYDKKAKLCRLKAKQFLKANNRIAAKNMLARSQMFQQKITQYSAMIMKAERRLDALTQAETLKEVGGAMETSAVDLKKASAELNLNHAMEVDSEAEAAIDEIEEAGDLFAGDPELDFGLDMDDELSQLETELMLEEAGELPEAPMDIDESEIAGMSLSLEDDEPASGVRDKDALKDEISKLKKELDL